MLGQGAAEGVAGLAKTSREIGIHNLQAPLDTRGIEGFKKLVAR